MKRFLTIIAVLSACITGYAQVSSDYAVMLTAEVNENPVSISVKWPSYATATSYAIYRKTKTSVSWGTSVTTLTGTATEYIDFSVVVDSGYEYRVQRVSSNGITAQGYIYAAIKLHATDYRGKCLLVVDTTVTSTFETELFRLMKDISGDGWAVKRIDVSRNDSMMHVKNLIVNEFNNDPDVAAVFLFGHVPVPYSGNLNPDGHADHMGAWPFDGFYGDMNGNYTDAIVNNTTASRQENWNVPGDGKFDQTAIPGTIELQVGRTDLYNLPAFTDSEQVLLINYLDKDHDFRQGNIPFTNRGLIDDNFGAFGGEAFGSVGWRNFSPLCGDTAVEALDYFGTMQTNDYLWSYGCGGGWYQGAGGVGSTSDFVNDTVQTVFTILFGSYFGDWDSENNFLRAPLASKNRALTCCWAGRPYWYFHHMALGDPVGASMKTTINNSVTYTSNYGGHWVHIALMGDPTLTNSPIKPASNITLSFPTGDPDVIGINWLASVDANVIGYYVYRSMEEFGKYNRISDTIVTNWPFVDFTPDNGLNWYMVRAVKLQETPSGSYYNLSTGISDSIGAIISGIHTTDATNDFVLFPNPVTTQVFISIPAHLLNEEAIIYDVSGRIIWNRKITSPVLSVNTTHFLPGVYLVRIKDVVKKMVVE